MELLKALLVSGTMFFVAFYAGRFMMRAAMRLCERWSTDEDED